MNIIMILIQATALMLALLALRPLLKKWLTPRARCAMWLIPAVRLLIPVEITSSFSIMKAAEPVAKAASTAAERPIEVTPPGWLGSGIGFTAENAADKAAGTAGAASTAANAAGSASAASITLGDILLLIWLIGAVICAGVIIWENLRFFRRTSRAAEPFRTECKLPVYLVRGLPSPCLAGVIRPRIYINECAAASQEVLDMTLRHEMTHYKRLDHIWGVLRAVITALYWFHPLVWISGELFRRDTETACDEAVTRGMDRGEREKYGMALISLMGSRKAPGGIVCLSTMSSGKKLLYERIASLSGKHKAIKNAAVMAAVIAVVLTCTMCAAPVSKTGGNTPKNDLDNSQTGRDGSMVNVSQTGGKGQDNAEDNEKSDLSEAGEYGTAEDVCYWLEYSALGKEFRDMAEDKAADIKEEYKDLLEGYTLIARESTDGKASYIVGEYTGKVKDSPLYMMYSVEFDGTEGMKRLLYREADSAAVEEAIMSGKEPSVGWLLTESRISYSSNNRIILIQPNDSEVVLDYALSMYKSRGSSYIQDAASRGIAINNTEEPYLYVYLISETFGEIAEKIPLTEDEAAAILAEERLEITEGFGFCAVLHVNGETEYYTEYKGVPRTVIDLATEKCGYKFADPSYIDGPIEWAVLECSWLDEAISPKAEDLKRLEEILKGAEFSYVGACGYGAKLTLGLAGGEQLTVFKGTDGCDSIVFGSYGGYSLGDKENTEFWQIFGLDPDTKMPVEGFADTEPVKVEGYDLIDGSPVPVSVTLEIEEVLKGEKAYEALREQDAGIKSPDDGHEYIIAYVNVKYDDGGLDVLDMSENRGTLEAARRYFSLSNANSNASDVTESLRNSVYDITLQKGDSKTGAVAFLKEKDNARPLCFVGFGQVAEFEIQ